MTARTQRAKRPRKFRCRVVAAGMLLGAFTVMSAPLLAQTPQATLNRHLEQAQVHLDARNYRLVVEELRQAIAIHPGIPGAYYQLGLALWHLHDMEESRIAFLKELEFAPPTRIPCTIWAALNSAMATPCRNSRCLAENGGLFSDCMILAGETFSWSVKNR